MKFCLDKWIWTEFTLTTWQLDSLWFYPHHWMWPVLSASPGCLLWKCEHPLAPWSGSERLALPFVYVLPAHAWSGLVSYTLLFPGWEVKLWQKEWLEWGLLLCLQHWGHPQWFLGKKNWIRFMFIHRIKQTSLFIISVVCDCSYYQICSCLGKHAKAMLIMNEI